MAFPLSPIIMSEEPIFVRFPKPLIANGQMPAQISEFAKPNNTINQIETSVETPRKSTFPLVIMIAILNSKPNMVQIFKVIC